MYVEDVKDRSNTPKGCNAMYDAFELDVNVVNFVHYGKTRMAWAVYREV